MTGKGRRLPTGAVLVVLLALAVVGCARGGRDVAPTAVRQFHLDWQVTRDARGAVVRGQLGNPYALPARDIHLLVEGLDGGGAVVTKTTSALRRIVLAGDRAPFDVPVGDAERYRVTVVSFDLVVPRPR